MLPVIHKLLPISQRRSGKKLSKVRFLVAHSTGNDGTTAMQNVNYFHNSAHSMQASAHYFIDDNDVILIIPEDEKAWHVNYQSPEDDRIFGCNANDYALGIELCFDSQNAKINSKEAYRNYVSVFAERCKKYNLEPRSKVISHQALDPTRRTDPFDAFAVVKKTWQDFISDIEKEIGRRGLLVIKVNNIIGR